MGILAEYTPDLEVMSIDEAYLDMTGFETIYGATRETAERIKGRIWDEVGLPASIGIASSAVVAKIATDAAKPNGLLEVPHGGEREFLAPLPVAGVGRKTESTLRGMGIATVGQLAAQSLSALKAVFGVYGEYLHRLANGIDDRRIRPRDAPPKSISRSTTFAEDTLDFSFLSSMLRYLTERVGVALRRQGMMARCVTLKLRYADFSTISRSRTLKIPQDGDDALFNEVLTLMKKALAERRQLVRLIGIGVSEFVEEGRQLSLEDGCGERSWQLNRVVDSLRQRYGFSSVQMGRTFGLKRRFHADDRGYVLQTPSLSR
jgi:DNA polymerase-4